MTIAFQGHVKSIETGYSNLFKVTLCTPAKEADSAEWIVYIPREQAQHWMPDRMVQFTLYTLPEPATLSVAEALARTTSGSYPEPSQEQT